MATINLPPKKKKDNKRNNTPMRELRQRGYNNSTWRKLRNTYLKEHALCQDCIAKGIITPATDIHHIKSPFQNGEINYNLLLDVTNLVSLCRACHGERHSKEQGYKPINNINLSYCSIQV
jgi:5-methylcytosine-specific restriction protein A